MGEIKIGNYVFPISGEEPNQEEWKAIEAAVASSQPSRQQPMPDLSNAIAAAGTAQNTLEDAPTTSRIELPGVVKLPKWLGGNDDEPISVGSKLALQYGTLSTDNPKARQEIYIKHLPGAKAVEDRWGNPMIEYKGQRYYTSRPGEIDAMDVGRTTAGVVGALPFAAVAPASIPGAMVVGGLLGAGQSVAEDVVTQASGGTSQQIDPVKAAVSGGVGLLAPALVGSIVPIARRLYGQFAGELFDAAGTPTARGAAILREAGITPEQVATMTPEMRQQITAATNHNFGSPEAAYTAHNRALGEHFNVPQTSGELTGDAAQLGLEKDIRGGSRGPQPREILDEFGTARQEGNLTQAQEAIRRQVGGGRVQTPQEAGEAFNAQFGREARQGRQAVSQTYDRALDPDEVVRAGGTPDVAISRIQGLPNAIENQFNNATRGTLIPTPENTPTTMQAIDRLRQFSQDGSIPSAFPGTTTAAGAAAASGGTPTAVGWPQIDLMRKQLSRLQGSIPNTPERATDRAAMRTVMEAFDGHLSQGNPLLQEAINTARQNFQTFLPGRQQTGLTQQVLKILNKPENAQEGAEVINKLFSTGLKKGEALGAVDHLMTINPPGSPGHQALAEQSLRRLFVDPKTGDTLTPRRIVTAIDQALGDAQGDVYRRLLSPEQINELIRFRTLNENVANALSQVNPPGSGHLVADEARKVARRVAGGSGGAAIAHILGLGWAGQAIAGAGGAVLGTVTGNALNRAAARAAVAPAANVGGVPAGAIAGPGGLLAAPAMRGPADRIMDGLLMP